MESKRSGKNVQTKTQRQTVQSLSSTTQVVYATDYDFDEVRQWEKLPAPRGYRKKVRYVNNVSAFDIEVSNIKKYEIGLMYIWQFAIDDHTVVYGRYWHEFTSFIKKLKEALPKSLSLVILVHNLSYEWQWLKSLLPITDVFAMDRRKILKFTSDNIEFRCSYLHSNMDLRHYLQTMNVKHQKLELDYKKVRYPWSKLDDNTLQYSFNDVLGLVEAYKYELEKDGDTVYTAPLTSTGYVRRTVKDVLGGYHQYLKGMLPTYEVLKGLNLSFRGGNTHGHRKYAGRIVYNVYKYDISSSYPATLAMFKFAREFKEGRVDQIDYYLKHNRAVLMHIHFYGLRLKNEDWGCPYLSKGKCLSFSNLKLDNGRILSGDCEMWINEIDLSIINSEYDYNSIYIEQCYQAQKSLLPYTFRKLIKEMFKKKTLLKGGEDGSDRQYYYQKYKNMINALYGMCCQNPLKPFYKFDEELNEVVIDEDITYQDIYDKYLKHGWLPYQIGCYCTSYARLKLERGLQAIPAKAFVYCDTDSIATIGDYSHVFEKLNEEFKDEEYSAYDEKGKKYYLGIYEFDGHCKAFKHLGAKRYAYIDDNDELHITISGVNKKLGAKELGCLENLEEGFTFHNAGRTESKYNDDKPYTMRIAGHDVEVISNIYITDTTYTIGLAEDYREVIAYLMTHDISKSLFYEYDIK